VVLPPQPLVQPAADGDADGAAVAVVDLARRLRAARVDARHQGMELRRGTGHGLLLGHQGGEPGSPVESRDGPARRQAPLAWVYIRAYGRPGSRENRARWAGRSPRRRAQAPRGGLLTGLVGELAQDVGADGQEAGGERRVELPAGLLLDLAER